MFALANYGSDDDSSSDASGSSSNNKAAATPLNAMKTAEAENSGSGSSSTAAVVTSPIPRPDNVQGTSAGWICGNADHLTESLPIAFLGAGQAAASQSSTPPRTTTTTPPLAVQLRQHKDFFNPKQMEQTVKSLNIQNPFASSCADTSNFAEWERDLLILEEQAREGGTSLSALGGGDSSSMAASDNTAGVQASDFVQDQISRALANTHHRS